MNKKIKSYGLKFNKSINKWDSALPLGNGTLGCLIYGDGKMRFAIDRIDLWDNRQSECAKQKDFTYKKLLTCVNAGNEGWIEKQRFFGLNDNFPYPSKLSGGAIELDFSTKTEDVRSELDIFEAVAKVYSEKFNISSFVCATENVGVIRVEGEYKINLHIPDYFSGDENGEWIAPSGLVCNDGTVEIIENGCLKYPRAKIEKEGDFYYYIQNTLSNYSFCLMCYICKYVGYSELFYTVVTTDDSTKLINYGKEQLLKAATIGHDKLFIKHKKWWNTYWKKSTLSLPDVMLEKAYYMSWYLFASTSRENGTPMPLQGVWTADSNALPPWNGDYHHDTNTQMSYWGYLKANRLSEGKVFVDYLWKFRNKFKEFAKKVFNVDGYIIPGCSSLTGEFMGTSVHYSFSPTGTVWAAKAFDDYFRYTNDIKFLKTKAYPFFVQVEKAINLLFVEKNGKLYLPLSSSPEIFEGNKETFSIGNTNFDQSLLLYLYKTLIEFCEVLQVDSAKYKSILNKLDDLYVSDDNILMLSEKIKLPYSHRHFSHLMSIYPLNLLTYEESSKKKIIDSSILELEQLGTGWWVGFSFAWCATLYAMQYNGNAAYEKLRMFVNGFLSPNGFHLNGDYKKLGYTQWHYCPFTLEALFAYCDSIQEMVLQDNKGYIELFPAIPEWWKNVSFIKFRVRGGMLVSAKLKDGKVNNFKIFTNKDCEIKVKFDFVKNEKVNILSNIGLATYTLTDNNIIEVSLKKGNNTILIDEQ